MSEHFSYVGTLACLYFQYVLYECRDYVYRAIYATLVPSTARVRLKMNRKLGQSQLAAVTFELRD